MNELLNQAEATPDIASVDSAELQALKEAEQHAQTLRQDAIEREKTRIRAVMAVLKVTPEELLGLPARKRRNSRKVEAE